MTAKELIKYLINYYDDDQKVILFDEESKPYEIDNFWFNTKENGFNHFTIKKINE